MVNSASNYASGSLEPPLGSITAAKGQQGSVCGSTFGLHQTTASVLSSLLPGYHTGSSQTGCDCLAAHDSHPSGLPPTAFPYKWKGLRQGAQPSGYRVWSFPQNTARPASRLSPQCRRLLLAGCVTASPQTPLPAISSQPDTSVEIPGRLVKPRAADAITD